MKKHLNELQKNICTFNTNSSISYQEIEDFISNTIVALAVGGQGTRLKTVTGINTNKNALQIEATGETLVERVIKMYAHAGIKKFVALVFANADSIKNVLGDGSHFGVEIIYSHDPEKPVGRGGAILNALKNQSISTEKHLIVHNPDDQIIDLSSFVTDIIQGHLAAQSQNALATAIVTKSTPYTFTGMKINNSVVEEIEMYPQIPVPAHIGVSIFNKNIYPYFEELFSLEEKIDFESVLFPLLAQQKKLFAYGIDNKHWIPVNDPKGLQKLQNALNNKGNNAS